MQVHSVVKPFLSSYIYHTFLKKFYLFLHWSMWSGNWKQQQTKIILIRINIILRWYLGNFVLMNSFIQNKCHLK